MRDDDFDIITPAARIKRMVAAEFHVSVPELESKLRTPNLVAPRMIAIYLIHTRLNLSYSAIGRLFSDRDHTTIGYSLKAGLPEKLEADPSLIGVVEKLEADVDRDLDKVTEVVRARILMSSETAVCEDLLYARIEGTYRRLRTLIQKHPIEALEIIEDCLNRAEALAKHNSRLDAERSAAE